MGFKTAEWAYTVPDLTAPQKAVLVALSFCRNDRSGKCCPSQQTLAAMTALSTSTVMRALAGLEDMGIVTRTRNTDKRGYRTADDFVLNVPNEAERLVGAAPSRQSAYQAQRSSLTVTLHEPNRHSDGATREQEIEQEMEQEVVLVDLPSRTFAEFWLAWPRKVSKPQAEKAWAKAIKRESPDTIYAAAVAYAHNPHIPDKQYVPHAATWLNGDRWNDELPGPRNDHRMTPGERNLAYVAQLAAQQAAETRGLPS